jgi:hypothetical protein
MDHVKPWTLCFWPSEDVAGWVIQELILLAIDNSAVALVAVDLFFCCRHRRLKARVGFLLRLDN